MSANGRLVQMRAALALALLFNPATLKPALSRFWRLKPLVKFAAICVFCALVWRGGAKNDGDRGGENPPAENAKSAEGGGAGSLRSLRPLREIYSSTNFPLAVTTIAADNSNRVVNVGPVGGISPVFGETTGTTGKNNIRDARANSPAHLSQAMDFWYNCIVTTAREIP